MSALTKDIPLNQIKVTISRARDKEGFKELKESMGAIGQLMPIQVKDRGRVHPDGFRYELICGEGRITAAKQLGWEKIAALIVDVDKKQFAWRFLAENWIRKSIPWRDKGRIIRYELSKGRELKDIAKDLFIKPEVASRYLRTLDKLAQDVEEEASKMGFNDVEHLTKLPKAGQRIVVEIAKEYRQSIKDAVEKAEEVQKQPGYEWSEASKADLRKVITGQTNELKQVREDMRVIKRAYVLGPMNVEKLLKHPANRKRLEMKKINFKKAEEAIKAASRIV